MRIRCNMRPVISTSTNIRRARTHGGVAVMLTSFCLWLSVGCAMASAQSSDELVPTRLVDTAGLENVIQLTPELFCGGQPADDGFASLKKLGIKTIVSVDGVAPNLESAESIGARYVHIPLGYGGIDEHSRLSLTAALTQCPPPIYVHCHQGRHRGPAAAALGLVLTGQCEGPAALDILRSAGTDKRYHGLWEAVRDAKAIDTEGEFPPLVESAEITPLVKSMAELLKLYEGLEEELASSDQASQLDSKALLMHDIVRELLRSDYLKAQGGKAHFETTLTSITNLQQALQTSDLDLAKERLKSVGQNCQACHAELR